MNVPGVVEALEQVYDPELGIDIVALGLIYGVTAEDGRIDVEMSTTSALCPMGDAMLQDARRMLLSRFPDAQVEVLRVTEPRWDLEMVSPEALGWLGVGPRTGR